MAEHSSLTGSSLHDVKGAATSTAGEILVSSGGVSTWGGLIDASTGTAVAGSHLTANGLGGSTFERVKGWSQFQDSRTTAGTPTMDIANGVRTKFLCDGGTATTERNPSDASTSMWNTTTNKHTPIAEFDVYYVRLGFTAENYSGTTPYITVDLDVGGSVGTICTTDIELRKAGSATLCTTAFPVYVDATYLANGADIYLTYEGTGSCDIHTTSVMVVRESKDYT